MNSIKKFMDNVSKQLYRNPYLYSLAATFVIVGMIKGGYEAVSFMFLVPKPPIWPHAGYLICILFLLILAKRYESQNAFIYDEHGVLWHGNESNISLRVATFSEMLKSIAENIMLTDDDKKYVFTNIGRNLGHNFGQQFKKQIYRRELINSDIPFEDLDKNERLVRWTKYDSATGWGLIEATDFKESLFIVAKHPTLFEGDGGKWFSYIMAGYSESVVNEMTSEFHMRYQFSDQIKIDPDAISFPLKLV